MMAWVLVPVLGAWRRRFPAVELDLKEYTSADRMLEVLMAAFCTSRTGTADAHCCCWAASGSSCWSSRTRRGARTPRQHEQEALDDVDDVQVSVTRIAPDLPTPRLELLHYHSGSRRAIPPDTASNDITATHCVVRVTSLDATAAALAPSRHPHGRR
jgi:hypothetical protein